MRLLLVDDHDDTLDLLARVLRAKKHTVEIARTFAAAEALCTQQNCFDLVICDIQLPGGTGWDLMSGVLRRVGIPGIALSGHGGADDLAKSRDAGFAAHLVKPIGLDTLESAIQKAVANPADDSR
jgi:CheY-like chemotaxis protein